MKGNLNFFIFFSQLIPVPCLKSMNVLKTIKDDLIKVVTIFFQREVIKFAEAQKGFYTA